MLCGMPEGIPPPLALSLIIAESHLVDVRTRQHSLIGIISQISAPSFPVMVSRLCMYCEISNGRGRMELLFRIVDADGARPAVVEATTQFELHDPLMIHQLGLGLAGLFFPEPGQYRAQLLCEGELLRERQMILAVAQPRGPRPRE
jgi:hypothetical protein